MFYASLQVLVFFLLYLLSVIFTGFIFYPSFGQSVSTDSLLQMLNTTFTHTFIYGKYGGVVNFLEPMTTKAFLETKPSLSKTIRQPEKWQRSSYFPDKYTINFDEATGVYSIALEGLDYVIASSQ